MTRPGAPTLPDGVVLAEKGGKDEGYVTAEIDLAKIAEVKAKPKLAGWFTGQVMKQMGGKGNPQAVNAVLKERLGLPDEG